MKGKQFTKEEIIEMVVCNSIARDQITEINAQYLFLSFGFKRMEGVEILLRQLVSTKTEEQLQRLQPWEMEKNIRDWAAERKFLVAYLPERDSWQFKPM